MTGCVPASTLPDTRIDCVTGFVGVVGSVGFVGVVPVEPEEEVPEPQPVRVAMPPRETINSIQTRDMDFMGK
jgi:hypothetical protein